MKPRIVVSLALTLAAAAPLAAQTPPRPVRVGDRVLLRVDGDAQLSDTFEVSSGPAVLLPAIGPIPLAGVARDTLSAYFTGVLGHYLRDPVVHAELLIRVGVVGEVAKPGYYSVPEDLLFSDLLMHAGGPTKEADVHKMKLERGDTVRWSGKKVQEAVTGSHTLAELGLQSGDQVEIPPITRHDALATVQVISILVAIPTAIYAAIKIF
ncbi:MAG TPA: SLBB domain-containing protein [Gemmatimonadales bacterium]|jgi:protein involved in polysaccharide export with SLBB domain|nr:SLBB domain-containing protein [Gemmatimonadales bacterium]